MRFFFMIIAMSLVMSAIIHADEITFTNPLLISAELHVGNAYRLRMVNGDILTVQFDAKGSSTLREDSSEVESIQVSTLIGDMTIYADEIVEILSVEEYYKHDSHLAFMPTANPIASNHYIGLGELLFAQAGFGYDRFSLLTGLSLVPGLSWQEQAKLINLKATLYHEKNVVMPGHYTIATGVNLAFPNSNNAIQHLYIVGSFLLERTTVTGMFFYKIGTADSYQATAGKYGSTLIRMSNGALGCGLGFDVKLSSRHDTRAIAELWCSDIMRPKNSAGFLGIRLSTSRFSTDIGLAMFSAPALIPAVNVQWLPF